MFSLLLPRGRYFACLVAVYCDHLSKGSLSLTYMSDLSSFTFLRLPDKVYKSEMSHHAGKAFFFFVLGVCTISQCAGPNCFLCENTGCTSRWLAEDLSLAGALRLRLQWLMEMVNTVLPPGSHVGARRERNIECALPRMLWVEEQGTPNLLLPFFSFL